MARAEQWKGVTSAGVAYGEPLTIKRPRVGLWAPKLASSERRSARRKPKNARRAAAAGARSVLPEVVELVLVRPPVHEELDDPEVRAEVLRRTEGLEGWAAEERQRRGMGVLGMRRCRRQHWNDLPGKPEDMFRTSPSVSARSKWARIEALERRAAFIEAYRVARDAWIAGERDVEFPAGTWLMRRRFQVRCAGPPR